MNPARPASDNTEVRVAIAAEFEVCRAIRRRVFIEGQGVPESLEFEGDRESVHFLARRDGVDIGAARLRVAEGKAKAERVAVLAAERRGGVGRALMVALERRAGRDGFEVVVLNAQLEVRAFYEGLGYSAAGDIFWEAGIPHIAMSKRLP